MAGPGARPRLVLGWCCLVAMVLCFVVQSEVARALERDGYDKPYFIPWLNHSVLALFSLPALVYICFFWLHRAARPSQAAVASVNAEADPLLPSAAVPATPRPGEWVVTTYIRGQGFSSWQHFWAVGLLVGILYQLPNYLIFFALDAKCISVSVQNTIVNSNCVFVYLFSCLFLRERHEWSKTAALVVALGGLACIGLEHGADHVCAAVLISLAATVLLGVYDVGWKKYAVREGRAAELPMVLLMLGQLGVSHILFLSWPMVALDRSGFERFELPPPGSRATLFLLLNVLLATLGNLGLMVALAVLPSPVLVSVSQLFTLPLSVLADFVLYGLRIPPLVAAGAALIVLAFGLLLAHDVRDARRARRGAVLAEPS